MTIDDRLTRAGQQFRDTHTDPVTVDLVRPDHGVRAELGVQARPTRRPRRLLGLAVAACAVIALTAGVVAWVASSGGSATRTPATPAPTASATATATAAATATAELARGPWVLVAVDTAAGRIEPPRDSARGPIQLQFDPATGTVGASDGCNFLGGPVVVDGSVLRFGAISTTFAACADLELSAAVEGVFSGETATWDLTGNTLTLTHDGTTLTYTRQASGAELAGSAWALQRVDDAGREVPLPGPPRHAPVLSFEPSNGTASAGDGCNSLSVSYRVDGSTIDLQVGGSTDAACTDTEELQRTIGRVFDGAAEWQVTGDQLTISRVGATLTYTRVTPASALSGVTWELVEVDTGTPPSLQPVARYTLTLSDDPTAGQQLRLDDDCNVTTVPVQVGPGTIVVSGQASSTAVGCTRTDDPAVTAAAEVFGADSATFSVSGDLLTVTGNGQTLTFRRA